MTRRPVIWWGSLGAASVVLIVVVLAQWVAGGVTSVDPGPHPLGGSRLVLLRVFEWGQFAIFLGIFWLFVVRPLLRRVPLGFDGLFVIAAVLLNFWDPLDNFWTFSFQYNAHHLNVGSWGGYIPFWHGPGPELWVVPIGFVFGAYTWAFFAAVRWGCAVLERVPGRRGWLLVFVVNATTCAVAENVYLALDAFANLRTPDALTLLRDDPFGWPVYNPLFFGLVWTAMTWLRWSRDDRGVSWAERGADTIGLSPRATTVVRFLAIFAFLQVAYIGLYFLPWNLLAAGAAPATDLPSYFPTP